MNLFWNILESSWGDILIVSNDKGLVRVTLPGSNVSKALNELSKKREVILTHKNTPLISQAKKQIEQYLNGERDSFNLDLDLQGTDFQKKAWKALLTIPFGQTCSYQDIAVKIGNPKAMRAVGLANNKNPIPLIVPCHRVIGKNGSLVGYGGGLPMKQKLLNLEQGEIKLQVASKKSKTSRKSRPHQPTL